MNSCQPSDINSFSFSRFKPWFKPGGLNHLPTLCSISMIIKGSMPPSIGHMELLVWMQRADFSEHIQGFKSPGDPLNSSHFDAPNTKSAPTGYRRAPNIISHHYKQQLSAKASIVPKARPIRFRLNGSLTLSAAQNSHKCHMRAKFNITRY